MPLNTDLHAPTIRDGLAFDTDLGQKTLRGVDILAPGDLAFVCVDSNVTHTYTFSGLDTTSTATQTYSLFPRRFWMQIREIKSSGTTISIDDLKGLH